MVAVPHDSYLLFASTPTLAGEMVRRLQGRWLGERSAAAAALATVEPFALLRAVGSFVAALAEPFVLARAVKSSVVALAESFVLAPLAAPAPLVVALAGSFAPARAAGSFVVALVEPSVLALAESFVPAPLVALAPLVVALVESSALAPLALAPAEPPVPARTVESFSRTRRLRAPRGSEEGQRDEICARAATEARALFRSCFGGGACAKRAALCDLPSTRPRARTKCA